MNMAQLIHFVCLDNQIQELINQLSVTYQVDSDKIIIDSMVDIELDDNISDYASIGDSFESLFNNNGDMKVVVWKSSDVSFLSRWIDCMIWLGWVVSQVVLYFFGIQLLLKQQIQQKIYELSPDSHQAKQGIAYNGWCFYCDGLFFWFGNFSTLVAGNCLGGVVAGMFFLIGFDDIISMKKK